MKKSEISVAALAIVVPALLLAVSSGRSDAEDTRTPQPAAIWPSGPLEVVAAFPVPLRPEQARTLVGRSIAYQLPQEGVGARPGETQAPKSLRIAGARLADGGRTLRLATDPHPAPARYSLSPGTGPDGVPELRYDLSGAEVTWIDDQADDAEPAARGWLPSLDLESLGRLAKASAPHERLLKSLAGPGKLTVSALITLPAGDHTVRVESSRLVEEVMIGDNLANPEDPKENSVPIDVDVGSRGEPQFFSAILPTGGEGPPPTFRVLVRGPGDKAFQPIAPDRLLLPWVPTPQPSGEPAPGEAPKLEGGDAKRGEALFFGEQARCGQCHVVRGRGAAVGPDLTEIGRKGREFLFRSIAAPSAEIDPEYLPYTVAARDGRVFAGLVRAEGPDAIRITDNAAKATTLRRDEIDQIRPSGTSIMPVGLAGAIGDQGLRDLISYLMEKPAR